MPAFFLILSVICLGAALVFLVMELAALRPGRAAVLAALALAAVWLALSVSVPVRGGYDNEHDFLSLGVDQRSFSGAGADKFTKELSPLAADAAGDLVSGRSLGAVLWKNRLLTLASAAALGLAAYALGGAAAGAAAVVLYLFNFLLILNSSSMASTAANLFFFASSVCALALYRRGGKPAYFYWSLASLWLLAAGRIELALFPLAVFVPLWAFRAARRLLRGPRDKMLAAEAVFMAVFLGCLFLLKAWLSSVTHYNGPGPGDMLEWLKNLEYQLGSANLAALLPFLKGQAAALTAAAGLAGLGLPALRPAGDRLRGSATAAVLILWVVYMSVFFMPLDRYPLHFMRHQAYFFLPAALLFAFVLGQAAPLTPGRRRALAAVAGVLALVYAGLNYRAARALDGELRTNDIEWQVLLEASRGLAPGCAVVYPEMDDSRHDLLAKYFRLARTGADLSGSCSVKYLPPIYQTPQGRPKKLLQQYNAASPGYVGAAEKPLFGRTFVHRFYSVWDGPASAGPIRIGFYPAETPRDKAWRLNARAALRPFSDGAGVEKLLKEALALDPDCDPCRYGLALRLALRGDSRGAAGELETIIKKGMLKDRELLAAGITDIALGRRAAAVSEFERFRSGASENMFYLMLLTHDFGGLFYAIEFSGKGARQSGPGGAVNAPAGAGLGL